MDENTLDLQQVQAEAIAKAQEDMRNGVEGATKSVNEGIKNFVSINNAIKDYEELEFKKQQAQEEMDFKKEMAEKDLELKKQQHVDEMEFKKQQAEEAKQARFWDIVVKVGIAIIPIIISSLFTVIFIKIQCKENRDTLMATMFANEVMERAGSISNVTAKDVTREALKQATSNKIK